MSASERRLRLVFVGDDQSGQAVKSVTSSLQTLRSAVQAGKQDLKEERQAFADSVGAIRERQKQERALSLEFKQNHSTFFRTADAIGTVGRTALHVNQIWQSYNITQLRLRDITKEVNEAQRRVQDSIRLYGAGSTEARQEIERYNKALEDQKRLNDELPAQYLTMGLSALYVAKPVSELTRKFSVYAKSALMAREASKATLGTGALSNLVLGGATGASLLGGRLGRAGSLLGRGGLYGAVATGGLALGGFLGGQALKAVYGEKEGNERFEGVLKQLGIKDMLDSFSGESAEERVIRDNSISIGGNVIIYTNSIENAQDLKASLQTEAMRQQSES
jgi:hypothetical protein